MFLAASDAGSCCAANYERFVFRDQKVLGLSGQFVTVRINRASAKADMLERFAVKKDRPALLVVDSEGVTSARFDLCTNAADVFKAMGACLKTSRKKVKVSIQMQGQFDDVKALVAQQSYRAAGSLLKKIRRLKGGPAAGARRVDRLWGEIEATGRELYTEAKDMPVPTESYDLLLVVRHEFWFFDAVAADARARITELESGEETAPVIKNHNGLKLVAEAEAWIAKGKAGKGRGILRKVRREFEGTEAAAKAAKLLD